jgi:hypothetical protein
MMFYRSRRAAARILARLGDGRLTSSCFPIQRLKTTCAVRGGSWLGRAGVGLQHGGLRPGKPFSFFSVMIYFVFTVFFLLI